MEKQCSFTLSSTSKPTFNGIPSEIRLQILENLLQVGDIVLDFEKKPKWLGFPTSEHPLSCVEGTVIRSTFEATTLHGFHGLSPAILAVSKSVNAEAAPVLYSKNNFKLPHYLLEAFQTCFLASIGRKNRGLIRKIGIGLTPFELLIPLPPYNDDDGSALCQNIPENLQRLTMSYDYIHGPTTSQKALLMSEVSPHIEEMFTTNEMLDVMAHLLDRNIKFMPWLSKRVVGPGRLVSMVAEDASGKHHESDSGHSNRVGMKEFRGCPFIMKGIMLEPAQVKKSLEYHFGRADDV